MLAGIAFQLGMFLVAFRISSLSLIMTLFSRDHDLFRDGL